MKYILIALLALANPLLSAAQKHFLYADGGLSLAYSDPGFSATYNYNLAKHFGLGLGAQGYVFHPAATNPRQFTPALFADFRFRIRPQRISQYFILADLGIDFYRHHDGYEREGDYAYSAPNDNGVYLGLGLGYFLRLTHRGWGPYATAKMISNFCSEDQLNLSTGDQKSLSSGRGTLVLSLGFRFGADHKINPPTGTAR